MIKPIPKRQAFVQIGLPKQMDEVEQITRVGGYYHWDWKFPFRHFVPETLYIYTKKGLFKLVNID